MTSRGRARLVRALGAALHHSGAGRVAALAAGRVMRDPGRGFRRAVPAFSILTYHRVNDDADPFFPAMPTAVFEQQIAHVARCYRVLPLEELAEGMARGRLPAHALAVTFDDGYRDNLTHATPILSRHGVPATFFLATGFIGSSQVPWFDRLAAAFKHTRAMEYTASDGSRGRLDGPAARLRALDRALEHLKRVPEDGARRDLDALLRTLGASDATSAKNAMLTWDDVHALAGLGFSIGAHTVTHPILSQVSRERARSEIEESRAVIESACGRAPRAFAYPNGGTADYTPAVVQLVREAGFLCAATTRFGLNTTSTSPWELRRGGPWESDLPTFALKLAWYQLASR